MTILLVIVGVPILLYVVLPIVFGLLAMIGEILLETWQEWTK